MVYDKNSHGTVEYNKNTIEVMPSPILDKEIYRDQLSSFQISKTQEDELLESLWHIMKTMVEIGWGVDTVQIILPEIFAQANTDNSHKKEKI